MRVLVINYEFPPLGGGGGHVAQNVTRCLAQEGVELAVLTAHWRGLPRRERVDGYTVYRTPSFRSRPDRCPVREMFGFLVCNVVPALRLARSWRPDVVHVHFAVPSGPLAYLLKRAYGIPYVITLHGGDIPGWDSQQTDSLYAFLLPFTRPIWHQASAVVAVSQGLKDLAMHAYPDVPVQVIPNGIDGDFFQSLPNPEVRAEAGRPIQVLFVGRIVEQKGLAYLLRSVRPLLEQVGPRFRIRIVGDGPLRADMEALVEELGIGDQIEFTGWVPVARVREFLQAADVFVLPSLMEGLSIALLQAMSCGLPVVATDAMGNNELVRAGDNGLLVPVGDAAALARALATLIEDQDTRARMGLCSREIAADYDWHTISTRYLSLFRQAVGPDPTIRPAALPPDEVVA